MTFGWWRKWNHKNDELSSKIYNARQSQVMMRQWDKASSKIQKFTNEIQWHLDINCMEEVSLKVGCLPVPYVVGKQSSKQMINRGKKWTSRGWWIIYTISWHVHMDLIHVWRHEGWISKRFPASSARLPVPLPWICSRLLRNFNRQLPDDDNEIILKMEKSLMVGCLPSAVGSSRPTRACMQICLTSHYSHTRVMSGSWTLNGDEKSPTVLPSEGHLSWKLFLGAWKVFQECWFN